MDNPETLSALGTQDNPETLAALGTQDNPETLAALGTQVTGRRQTKPNTTVKTKKMSNTDLN